MNWFNGYGDQVDTVEREEIFEAVEALCRACGRKPLVREIDQWRDF